MKQAQKTNVDKGVSAVAGTFWVVGLLVAGSDSSFMPWVNIIGLILFFCASFLIGTRLQKMDRQHHDLMRHKKSLRSRKHTVNPVGSERRVHMRYA